MRFDLRPLPDATFFDPATNVSVRFADVTLAPVVNLATGLMRGPVKVDALGDFVGSHIV